MEYVNLTKEEKKFLCDGVGHGKFQRGLLKPLNWIFKEDAWEHDFDYWHGCTENDRIIADGNFLDRLIATATYKKKKTPKKKKRNFFIRFLLTRIAYNMHQAVMELGDNNGFYFSDKKKTRDDLIKEMKKNKR